MSTKLTGIDFRKELDKLSFINESGVPGADGTDGTDGADGRSIVSIIRTVGDGSPGTTDTYTITYSIAPLTSTFNVYHGADGEAGVIGLTGATGETGLTGATGAAGADGADGVDGKTLYYENYDPTDEGVDDDGWINFLTWDFFKKEAGTWGTIGNILGATGAAGTDGTAGDQWTNSATDPTNDTVLDYNLYCIQTVTDHVWVKYINTSEWVDLFSISGDKYYGTSVTATNLSAYTVGDDITLTVEAGLSYSIGQFLVIASSTSLYFVGKVVSYSSTTLVVEMTYKVGNTTSSSWTVNLAGITESLSNPRFYYIELPNAATLSQRCDTIAEQPVGWTIDSGDQLSNPLSSNSIDLIVYHNLGKEVVDVMVKSITVDKQVKLIGPVAYATFEDNDTKTYLCIKSFSETATSLGIFITFED